LRFLAFKSPAPEDVEGLDLEDLAYPDIARYSDDQRDHAEGQPQVSEGDHRCVVGQPGPGDPDHQRHQADAQSIADQRSDSGALALAGFGGAGSVSGLSGVISIVNILSGACAVCPKEGSFASPELPRIRSYFSEE
jgi:hypothetical protein